MTFIGHDSGLIVFKHEQECPGFSVHGDSLFYVTICTKSGALGSRWMTRFHNAPYADDIQNRIAVLRDVGLRESPTFLLLILY